MGVNGTTAVLVEAKHSAEPKHVAAVTNKAQQVKQLAVEGRVQRLRGIKTGSAHTCCPWQGCCIRAETLLQHARWRTALLAA